MPTVIDQQGGAHGKRYDSVHPGGTMYVVYDNYKAYPMYYVRYKAAN